jgi:hypothetical protein
MVWALRSRAPSHTVFGQAEAVKLSAIQRAKRFPEEGNDWVVDIDLRCRTAEIGSRTSALKREREHAGSPAAFMAH